MVTHIYFAVLRKVAISKYVSTTQSVKFPLKKDFFYECEPISRLLIKESPEADLGLLQHPRWSDL